MKPVPRMRTSTNAGGIGASHQLTSPSPSTVSRVAEAAASTPHTATLQLFAAAPAMPPLFAASVPLVLLRPPPTRMSIRLYGPSNGTKLIRYTGVAAAGTADNGTVTVSTSPRFVRLPPAFTRNWTPGGFPPPEP